MRQRILNHVCLLVTLSVVLTFVAVVGVLYYNIDGSRKETVREEAEYIKYALEQVGDSYLTKKVGDVTNSRITLLDEDGTVLFDSVKDAKELENHGNRPEFVKARKTGSCEMTRFSETLSQQTYYYALLLDSGEVLRVSKTEDSIFYTMSTSLTLLGILLGVVLIVAILASQRQVKQIIAPINHQDLEHPLKNVRYEELRPLLVRVDQQNKQIAEQVEELKQKQFEKEKAEMVRKEFSANVSHELKTPLMSISGYAELLKNGMVRSEDVPEFAGRIYKEASRLKTLVEDIIQLSKMDESKNQMPFEQVDLYEMTKEIVSSVQVPAARKNVSLEFTGDAVSMEGVRQVLYEIFYNLVDNAIKYNQEGGKVSIWLKEEKRNISWTICDTGIGVAKEEQERIFERFYRVDKSHSRSTGGTGLGLSIVKHGAMLHRAKVNIESELGKGTEISIRFPKSRM